MISTRPSDKTKKEEGRNKRKKKRKKEKKEEEEEDKEENLGSSVFRRSIPPQRCNRNPTKSPASETHRGRIR
jgi:hypothetical protein